MGVRRTFAVASIVASSSALAVFVACTGDDPNLVSSTDDGATPGTDGGATEAGNDAALPGCGVADTTPCNCGPTKSCCLSGTTFGCYTRGTEDQDAASGCGSLNTLNCVGSNCGGGRVCCFNGVRTTGSVCPYRLTAFDTRCETYDAAGGHPCTDTSNGFEHELLCTVDADCEKFDAGACRPALMDDVNRVMNVCVR
jgi:hypothetical protein